MGAEWFEGIIKASSVQEAIDQYKKMAPSNACDYFGNYIYIQKMNVKVYEDKTILNYESAIQYLSCRLKKWDDYTGMIQYKKNEFAWAVLLPN
jgi:hypothetical protein